MSTSITSIHRNGNNDVTGQHSQAFNWKSLKRRSRELIIQMSSPGKQFNSMHSLCWWPSINLIKRFDDHNNYCACYEIPSFSISTTRVALLVTSKSINVRFLIDSFHLPSSLLLQTLSMLRMIIINDNLQSTLNNKIIFQFAQLRKIVFLPF